MANAIKKISVQRGYDVTRYTLNCFGGAGGQHACLVADALGMTKVFCIPSPACCRPTAWASPTCGRCASARSRRPRRQRSGRHGNGLCRAAGRRAVRTSARSGGQAPRITRAAEGAAALRGHRHGAARRLRQPGRDAGGFEAAHRQRFGFVAVERKLVVEAVAVEVIGATEEVADPERAVAAAATEAAPRSASRCTSGTARRDTPVYDRDALLPGQKIDGPAIDREATATTVVEPGWQAELTRRGHLVLTRVEARPKSEAVGTEADPVMLEVFNNLYMSIAEQMGATLANTAYSVNIKERLDFSCAIFDPDGNLVANAPHMPVHLGSMGESIKTVIRENRDSMRPGDVYALNAPYNGGTHLPDVTVITPVFDDAGEELLFYVGSRGHHADIGGRTPGSTPPDSTTIDEEGVLIDNFLLVEEGRFRENETLALLGSGRYPCRNPQQNLADLAAQIAANETGVQEVRKMVAHFGLDVVQAYMRHVQDNAEESVRRVLDVLKDGQFSYPLDNGSRIEVKITVDKAAREATVDFTGTSPQDRGNFNAPTAVCKAAVLYVFRTLVEDEIPLNEGCLKPLKLIIPERSMISPEYPAAVIAGNTEVSQCITDALYGALGVLASAQGTMNNFVYGNDRYQNYETICGGTGAGPDHDGTSAVHSHMTNTRMTDPEVLEWRFPVRLEAFRIRHGSGGAGKHRGGDGVVRRMRFLEPMTATILSLHRTTDPYGLAGGEPGQRGRNTVIRADGTKEQLKGSDETEMRAGDVFLIETPGGGGYGKAAERREAAE
jgi:5-oxoprolinase (ATP-hydrolysing)